MESGLWHVTLNGSSYRAYMLQRYLNPHSIPEKYKWGVVFKTGDWVLENCSEHHELKQKILDTRKVLENGLL